MLRICKMMLPIFKGCNNRSKCALKLLHFVIQHQSIFSEHESHQVLYALFVNNRGHIDSNFCADMQMEHIVKEQKKKQIKHMYSNKTEANILRCTAALHGMATISEQFDKQSRVLVCAKHLQKCRQLMMKDLS